jgi:hypothetical protein
VAWYGIRAGAWAKRMPLKAIAKKDKMKRMKFCFGQI